MCGVRCNHGCSIKSAAALCRMLFFLLALLLLLAPHNDAAPPSRAIAVEIGKMSAAVPKTAASSAAQRSRSRKLDEGVVQVRDCENEEYSGTIGLGTPAQEFEVVFTTGSYLLWVGSADCVVCGSANRYDSSLSSTYVADGSPFSLDYDDGSNAQGIISADKLSVGGLSTTVTFGEIIELKENPCGVDGVMGMGLTNEDGQNAFEDLLDAGVVDVPIFSFFMGNIDTDTPTGVLTLGGVNQTHYEGCLEWMAVSHGTLDPLSDGSGLSDFWTVVLKDLKVGSESMLRSEAVAAISTGTSMVVGPHSDVGALAKNIGAVCIKLGIAGDVEELDCVQESADMELIVMYCDSDFADVNFYFGGDDFALTAKELLQPLSDFGDDTADDPYCLFGMMGHDLLDTWILGDSFLRTFYTAYNVHDKTIGLAPATAQRTGEECEADAAVSTGYVGDAPAPAPTVGSPADASGGVNPGDSGANEGGDSEEHGGTTNVASGSEDSGSGDREAEGGEGRRRPSVAAVATAAAVGSLTLFAVALAIAVLVRRRLSPGRYGQVDLGGGLGRGGGGLEMSGRVGGAPRHGADVSGPEDEFLQGKPSETGSGSHFYRASDGGGKRVVLSGRRDGHEDEDDGDVEVDFGEETGRNGRQGAVSGGARAGPLGRLLGGPGRAGFAAVEDGPDGAGTGGRLGDA